MSNNQKRVATLALRMGAYSRELRIELRESQLVCFVSGSPAQEAVEFTWSRDVVEANSYSFEIPLRMALKAMDITRDRMEHKSFFMEGLIGFRWFVEMGIPLHNLGREVHVLLNDGTSAQLHYIAGYADDTELKQFCVSTIALVEAASGENF